MATSQYINKIVCIDCKDGLKNLDNFSIDLVITSPPYYDSREYAEYQAYYIYLRSMEYIMRELYRVLKKGGVIAWNVGDIYSEGLDISSDASKQLRDCGFRIIEKIIWQKPVGISTRERNISIRVQRKYLPAWNIETVLVACKGKEPNYAQLSDYDIAVLDTKYRTQVWNINPVSCLEHPAVFPEELVLPFILAYTRKGDIVLDPFCGVGTSLIVAKKYGRRYIGFDYVKKYCDIAEEKFAKTNEVKRTLQKLVAGEDLAL